MKKGLLLSLIAVILVSVIIAAVWYINRRGELQNNSKDSFIPYNSAVVLSINPKAALSPKMKEAFERDIKKLGEILLYRVADTLIKGGYTDNTSKVVAVRAEGNNRVALLFVMDNRDVLSRGGIVEFLKGTFQDKEGRVRKYDQYKIYALKAGDDTIYYAVEEGMILVSDSELYVEDALKQFEHQQEGKEDNSRFKSINKYFSAGAGINVFLNTGCFSDLLPRYLQTDKLFSNLDITKCFKWGALDGELSVEGVGLNGFMSYAGLENSYMSALEGQRPKETNLDGVIPSQLNSFFLLNLTDLKAYLSALEKYRYNAGLIEQTRKRKQDYDKILGSDSETELRELLQGEFALVNMTFDQTKGEQDGIIIAYLKSGGLCKALIEKMVANNARRTNTHPESYRRVYNIDRDKSMTYYKFPAEELASVYWGHIFEGVKSRYVLVEDNYLVLASSEKAVVNFIKDYIHRSGIKDVEWYKKMRTRLSAKYNLAYFAEIEASLPYYESVAQDSFREYLGANREALATFSTVAMQWSNEGGMLYNTIYLSTDKVEDNVRPHILWQTKLDGKVSMKPVPVVNHNTGERELFVQDDNNTIYLINDAGRILWRSVVDGRINSEIYQVDALKNGKLQYLFSTPGKLYLVDRNGDAVGKFPVAFKTACNPGISVYDYDKDRNYRIFAPCADREVYLYDIGGKLIEGWDNGKADKEIVTKVNYYRVENKDYIVFADRYRLYILDRKGKERVRVSTVFDLKDNTDIYLTKKGGQVFVAFANTAGPVNLVDFDGNVRTIKCGDLSAEHHMNVADINNDGIDDYIFTNARHLMVFDQSGKTLYDKELDAQGLDYPYVYRFSGQDIRIGLLDKAARHMILFDPDKGMSKGFPIAGNSPFSIVFGTSGDFYLFAGTDDGSLIKYRVQRN